MRQYQQHVGQVARKAGELLPFLILFHFNELVFGEFSSFEYLCFL